VLNISFIESSGVKNEREIRLSEIQVGQNESLEQALRRFTKRVQTDGILMDYRKHEYYEKPSERRKKKEAARVRKMRKAIIKATHRKGPSF